MCKRTLRTIAICTATYFYDSCFLSTGPPPTDIYTLSLHDALPISVPTCPARTSAQSMTQRVAIVRFLKKNAGLAAVAVPAGPRSEEHTSELQSHSDLVCRLLLEKKKNEISGTKFCYIPA